MEGSTPGETAVASPCEMEGMVLDERPALCGSVPAYDHGVPVPDEGLQLYLTTFPPSPDCPRSHSVCPGIAQLVPQPM